MARRRHYFRRRRASPRVIHRRRRYSRLGHYRIRHKAPLPLAPVIGGVVAPMVGAFEDAGGLPALQSSPMDFGKGMLKEIGLRYVGIDLMNTQAGFTFDKVIPTYTGLIAGVVAHKIANKAGVNRYMKRLPFIGGKVAI